jgi:hypothetical protein
MQGPTTTEALTYKYRLERHDVLSWHLWLLRRNRILWILVLAGSTHIAVQGLASEHFVAHSIIYRIGYVVFFDVAMLIAMAAIQSLFLVLWVYFRQYPGWLCEHILQVTDDGISKTTDIGDSRYRWAGVRRVIATRRHMFIHFRDHGMHIVPRRFFASEEHARAFQYEIERRIPLA